MIAVMALLLGASDPGLAPFDYLVGHCWRGDLPKKGEQDTHCFSRLDDGRIKDSHTVSRDGKPVFGGDTFYSWDAAAKVVRYVYTDDFGGRMTGTVVPVKASVLDFPDGVYVTRDGVKITIRTTWEHDGDSWITAQVSPTTPALDRTTRYARID